MKIAFLGLGKMGSAMARRLLAAGHEVTVWNRTRERADALAGKALP
jgi:3-hydroxyisobutyrate dehydrogenase-like beta-hydroxyacid dehydrogenase